MDRKAYRMDYFVIIENMARGLICWILLLFPIWRDKNIFQFRSLEFLGVGPTNQPADNTTYLKMIN